MIDQASRTLQKRFPTHNKKFEGFLAAAQYELAPPATKEQILAHRNLVRDVTDVPVALAAIAAGVDYLVSEDKDLTIEDETTTILRAQVNAVICGTFLRTVMGWTSEQLDQVRNRSWRDLPDLV